MNDEIEVNGVKYRRVQDEDEPLRICILDRGRVIVGNVSFEGKYVVIRNANCIRCWGTTKGLGEIAIGGPTSKTKLDKQLTTRVHELKVIEQIDCDGDKWE